MKTREGFLASSLSLSLSLSFFFCHTDYIYFAFCPFECLVNGKCRLLLVIVAIKETNSAIKSLNEKVERLKCCLYLLS
jgi:hypothetical protein